MSGVQGSPSDFNDTEGFGEYDPDPYDGGYDIAKTYGQPLPPSSVICYPLDAEEPKTPSPPPASDAPPSPPPAADAPPSPPPAVPVAAPPPEPQEEGKVEEKEEVPPYKDLSGTGYLPWKRRWLRKHFRKSRFWHGKCSLPQWAADYLFEYFPVSRKKRSETHNHGNPNYAHDRHNQQKPITIMVDPNESVDSWTSEEEQFYSQTAGRDLHEEQKYEEAQNWYGGHIYEEQGYPLVEHVNAYERQSFGKTFSVEVEPDRHGELSYRNFFQEEGYPFVEHVRSYESHYEKNGNSLDVFSGGLNYGGAYQGGIFSPTEYVNAYERPSYQNSISVEHEPAEIREVSYHVVQSDGADPLLEYKSAYERRMYEKPFTFEIEHPDLKEVTYHGNHTEYVSPCEKQSYEYPCSFKIESDLPGSLSHNEVHQDGVISFFGYVNSYDKDHYDQPTSGQIDPKGQTWYREEYGGNMYHHDETINPDKNNSYEQHSDNQIEPYQPTWSRNLHYNGFFQEEVPPQFKEVEGSQEYDAWSSWLFR